MQVSSLRPGRRFAVGRPGQAGAPLQVLARVGARACALRVRCLLLCFDCTLVVVAGGLLPGCWFASPNDSARGRLCQPISSGCRCSYRCRSRGRIGWVNAAHARYLNMTSGQGRSTASASRLRMLAGYSRGWEQAASHTHQRTNAPLALAQHPCIA
jgi:hypothetical protein